MGFWGFLEADSCLPNDCSCELIGDAIIRQPVNFWSSLAYVLSIGLLYRTVRVRSLRFHLWTFGTGLIALGSFFTHASFTRLAMAMDFAGITYLLSLLPVLRVAERRAPSQLTLALVLLLFYGLLLGLMWRLGETAKIGLSVAMAGLALVECGRLGLFRSSMGLVALAVLATSAVLFFLDEARLACDPHGLLQPHALWHGGTALGLYLIGRWWFSISEEA